MSFSLRASFCFLALSLHFISPAFAQSPPATSAPAAQQPADETALRALTESFFHIWAAKDMEGFLRLWSATSTDFETRRKSTMELFASVEKIELRSLTILAVKVEGDNARVRVEAEVQVIEVKTGKEKPGYGKMLRTLGMVRQDGVWKVTSERSAYDELALDIASAANDEERARLLAANADFPAKALVEALLARSRQFRFTGKLNDAETLLKVAQAHAEKFGEQRMLVITWLNYGEYFVSFDNYDRALEQYQKALTLAETLGTNVEMAGALRSIGTIHEARGNYDAALERYQKALPLAEAANEKRFMAAMYQDAARIHVKRGELEVAI